MPKYDAFGREIGEDTVGGLGSGATSDPAPDVESSEDGFAGLGSGATASAAPDVEPAPPRPAEPQPQPQPQPQPYVATQATPKRRTVSIPLRQPHMPRRRRRGLGFVVLFVLFIFVAPLVIGAVAIFNVVDGATDAVRDGIGTGIEAGPNAPSLPGKPAGAPPKGIAGRSLVRKANFAPALTKLRSSEQRLTNLRLAPERIDATLLTRAGRLRHVQVQPGGALERFGPDSGEGFDNTSTIPFARLDPAAPQRLARRGAAKLGVPVSTLQYLVPTDFNGTVRWAAYFKRGRYVLGDAAGRYQKSYP